MATSNDLNISQAGVVSFDGTAVFTGSPLTQHDVLVGGASNAITNVSPSTAGFVLTSNGISADPSFQALPFTKMPWTDENTSFSASSQNGYFITGTATATLPASPSQGDIIEFVVRQGATLTIQASGSQLISIGSQNSTAGGTATSNAVGDSVTLVYRSTTTRWNATSVIGTFTLA